MAPRVRPALWAVALSVCLAACAADSGPTTSIDRDQGADRQVVHVGDTSTPITAVGTQGMVLPI